MLVVNLSGAVTPSLIRISSLTALMSGGAFENDRQSKSKFHYDRVQSRISPARSQGRIRLYNVFVLQISQTIRKKAKTN